MHENDILSLESAQLPAETLMAFSVLLRSYDQHLSCESTQPSPFGPVHQITVRYFRGGTFDLLLNSSEILKMIRNQSLSEDCKRLIRDAEIRMQQQKQAETQSRR